MVFGLVSGFRHVQQVVHVGHAGHIATAQGHFFSDFLGGCVALHRHGAGFAVKLHVQSAQTQVLRLDVGLDAFGCGGVQLVQRGLRSWVGSSGFGGFFHIFVAKQLFASFFDKTEHSHVNPPVVNKSKPQCTAKVMAFW